MANFKAEPGTIVRFPAGHTLAEMEGVIVDVGADRDGMEYNGSNVYRIQLDTLHNGMRHWWAYRHEFRCIGREEKQDQ